jgi:hypothetical protein
MARLTTFSFLIIGWLMTPGLSHSRQVFPLKYDELFKRAELVVIANALSTVDAGEDVKGKGNNKYRIAVLSTLKLIHVIKGEHKAKQLVVFHYRFTEKGEQVANSCKYIKFDISKKEDWSGSPFTAYLLFLKKRKDGRYCNGSA